MRVVILYKVLGEFISSHSLILPKMTKKRSAPSLVQSEPPPPSDDDDSSSGEDSHIELRPPSGLTKTGKPKKEWVYTEARKAAFERARNARAEMGNTKKQIIEVKAKLREVKKEKLTKLKDAVDIEMKKKQKLEKKLAPSSDEESDAPEPVIMPKKKSKSKKAKKVKQVMYYDSDSTSSSSEDEGRRSKKPVNVVIHNGPTAPPERQVKPTPRVGLFI